MKLHAPARLLKVFGILTVLMFPILAESLPDTLNILAIRVEFQPDQAASTTGDGTFDLRQSNDPFQIDPPPHDRAYFQDHLLFARNYFRRVSRGRLTVLGDVFPRDNQAAYQLPAPMTDYNPNTSPEDINQGLARLLRDAVLAADADPEIDFSRYNSFIVFHAGVGRDIDLGLDATPQDIASLYITGEFLQTQLGIEGIPVDEGRTIIRSGIILPETESQEGIQLGLNGMLASNLGSQLGFPDLFSSVTRSSGVGRFGLMDAGLFNGDGLIPPIPTAWTRVYAGWAETATFFNVQGEEITVLNPLDGVDRVMKFPINEREYFLVENRYSGPLSLDSLQFVMSQQRAEIVSMREVLETHLAGQVTFSDSTGVLVDVQNPDIGLPGGGILIWHIDEQVIEANLAINHINDDPEHRGVDLEEADGSQDIGASFEFISGGAGSEIGTALDPWYAGNDAPLYTQSPRGEFSLHSIPNSRSYYNRANSHIRLYDFSARGPSMTFKADIGLYQEGFPQPIDTATYGKITSLKTADVEQNGTEVVLLTTDQGRILQYPGAGQWSTDSLQIVQLPPGQTLLPPLAIFKGPNRYPVVCAATREGLLYGFEFNPQVFPLDTLFEIDLNTTLTTYPIVESIAGTDQQFIYLGSADGKVLRINLLPGAVTPEELWQFPTSVRHLHPIDPRNLLVVTDDGRVYQNDQAIGQVDADVFRPAGLLGETVSPGGQFYRLLEPAAEPPAEEELHRFEASPIVISVADDFAGVPQTNLIGTSQNRLLLFNYNYTLKANFPVDIYKPARESHLGVSPIAAWLPGPEGEDRPGVLIADPAGLLAAYDLEGNPLPDFPLALGDSLGGSPAFLQMDGDAQLELVAATRGGMLYGWELPSTWRPTVSPFWPQQFATPGNLNRETGAAPIVNPGVSNVLMPEKTVYNWPNPNQDNFTFIRYRLNSAAEVQIKIFDLAGDLVKTLRGSGDPNTDNEVRWDLTNVQSGVYFARVEARGDQKTAVQLIKIAVIK